jgi:hypothetical protein
MPTRSSIVIRRFPLTFLCAAIPLVGVACSGVPSGDGRSAARRTVPEWYTQALEDSRQTLEVRCNDTCPLGIAHTGDPLLLACVADSSLIVASERRKIYDRALAACVSRGLDSAAGCCLEKQTDNEYLEFLAEEECTRQCADALRRPINRMRMDLKCHPMMASPERPKTNRAHTPDVQAILLRCAVSPDAQTACRGLPSHLEQQYCEASCPAKSATLNLDISRCARRFAQTGVVSCDEQDNQLRSICETRCRQQSRQTGSDVGPPSSFSEP